MTRIPVRRGPRNLKTILFSCVQFVGLLNTPNTDCPSNYGWGETLTRMVPHQADETMAKSRMTRDWDMTIEMHSYFENCTVCFPFGLINPFFRFVNLEQNTKFLLSIDEDYRFEKMNVLSMFLSLFTRTLHSNKTNAGSPYHSTSNSFGLFIHVSIACFR